MTTISIFALSIIILVLVGVAAAFIYEKVEVGRYKKLLDDIDQIRIKSLPPRGEEQEILNSKNKNDFWETYHNEIFQNYRQAKELSMKVEPPTRLQKPELKDGKELPPL